MEALFISADQDGAETNCSRYRIFTPAKYLEKAGHTIRLQKNPGVENLNNGQRVVVAQGIDFTKIPEVVLIERNLQSGWIENLRLAGAKKIIATFDDNYALMQKWAKARPWWDKYHGEFLKSLGLVDLVIVPSMALLDFYKSYCQKIVYVPNFMDDALWEDVPEREGGKTIGWGGSDQHVESWQKKKVARAIARVLAENQGWELKLVGNCVPDFVNMFPIGTKIKWHNWVPHSEWPKLLSSFDIGLAPLHGEYDRYRSNLKLVEYGLGRVPWIATWSDPYTRTHVRGGILVKETDWYSALSSLVRDELARKTLAKAGREWADGFRMSRNVSVYESLLWS